MQIILLLEDQFVRYFNCISQNSRMGYMSTMRRISGTASCSNEFKSVCLTLFYGKSHASCDMRSECFERYHPEGYANIAVNVSYKVFFPCSGYEFGFFFYFIRKLWNSSGIFYVLLTKIISLQSLSAIFGTPCVTISLSVLIFTYKKQLKYKCNGK